MTRPRRVIILGSTGSIGRNTLDVIEHLRATGSSFEVVGLAAGSNASLLAEQAARFGVKNVAIADPEGATTLVGLDVRTGPRSATELVERIAEAGDLVIAAMVGAAGVPCVLAAIGHRCDVALANKETLVAAGAIVMPRARELGVEVIPIDSEHSAIAQCLRSGRDAEEVRRIVLTASGGPFRTWAASELAAATPEQALRHPTWSMGRKITIDSATLMNKALEVIEAHWLFGFTAEQIDVIVHPQSIIHGLVEFRDGSVVAQMGPPDMRTPIQYALTGPDRRDGSTPRLDIAALASLDLEPVDDERFPAVRLAGDVIRAGGTAGAILNAANEEAVMAFLAGTIPLPAITGLTAAALDTVSVQRITAIEDVLEADRAARAFVRDRLPAAAVK